MSFDNAISIPNKKAKITMAFGGMNFSAPEVFLGTHTRKVDEFSAGVLMFYLLGSN
jgi:hypothetical protein